MALTCANSSTSSTFCDLKKEGASSTSGIRATTEIESQDHSKTIAMSGDDPRTMRLLQVCRSAVQQLFSNQRQNGVDALMTAIRHATEAAKDFVRAGPGTDAEQRTRVAADAVAAIVKAADRSRQEMSAHIAQQHDWAQDRLLSSFCSDTDYKFNTC